MTRIVSTLKDLFGAFVGGWFAGFIIVGTILVISELLSRRSKDDSGR